jgi:hypothetical protein
MLRGGQGQIWTGTHDLTFEHHKTTTSLRRSREADCSICIVLVNILRQEVDLLEDKPLSILAYLSKLPKLDNNIDEIRYRLEFRLEKRFSRMFLLKELGMGPYYL